MSPLSKDLFHQAIAESGVDLCPWKFKKVPLMISFNSHEGATAIRRLVGTAGLENGVN